MTTLNNVPEVVNHEALRQALTSIRANLIGRQEDVHALRERAAEVATALEHVTGSLTQLQVDPGTIAVVHAVAEAALIQAGVAGGYVGTIDTAATQAAAALTTAERNHGRIADAVADAGVAPAKPPFYRKT